MKTIEQMTEEELIAAIAQLQAVRKPEQPIRRSNERKAKDPTTAKRPTWRESFFEDDHD